MRLCSDRLVVKLSREGCSRATWNAKLSLHGDREMGWMEKCWLDVEKGRLRRCLEVLGSRSGQNGVQVCQLVGAVYPWLGSYLTDAK